MDENKLPHSIFGALLSWVLTILSWSVTHVGYIAGIFAIGASIYSILASRETIRLRKKQEKQIDDDL
jgi:hypothetical protein